METKCIVKGLAFFYYTTNTGVIGGATLVNDDGSIWTHTGTTSPQDIIDNSDLISAVRAQTGSGSNLFVTLAKDGYYSTAAYNRPIEPTYYTAGTEVAVAVSYGNGGGIAYLGMVVPNQ